MVAGINFLILFLPYELLAWAVKVAQFDTCWGNKFFVIFFFKNVIYYKLKVLEYLKTTITDVSMVTWRSSLGERNKAVDLQVGGAVGGAWLSEIMLIVFAQCSSHNFSLPISPISLCVCVCVCVNDRKRWWLGTCIPSPLYVVVKKKITQWPVKERDYILGI